MLTCRCDANATAVGSRFPTAPFSFSVHSVFNGAVNIRPESGGLLLSLVSDQAKLHPRAALVPGMNFSGWSRARKGVFDGTVLRFETDSGDGAVAVPPLRAKETSERPAPDQTPADPDRLRSVLRPAVEAVATDRRQRRLEPSAECLWGVGSGAVESPFAVRFLRSASAAAEAAEARSSPDFVAAAEGLIGLGPGLTPSGDDFLCGFLAALRAVSASDSGLAAFLDRVTGAADGALPFAATTDVSAAFLAEAFAGRFGAALTAFADAARGLPPRSGCGDATAELLGIGHSSGSDAAAGFLFGYRMHF